MEEMIRFGIAGCGMISNLHARALDQLEGACLSAAFDTNRESLELFAKENRCSAFYDYEEMLQSGMVDAVCICTPSGFHASQTLMACEAGIHVLVEKPMALNIEDANQIVVAAEKCRVKVGVVSQLRFSEGIQQVKHSIDTGAFGKLILGNISMNYYRTPEYYASSCWKGTWRMDGGGALMNQGIHGVDLLRYLMGNVKSVSGRMKTRVHKIEVEDVATAVIEYENGALGTLCASTCSKPGTARIIEISGENGMVVLEEDQIIKWDVEGTPRPVTLDCPGNKTANDPKAISHRGHYLQLKDFTESIRENRQPLSDAKEGMKTIELICNIYESAFKFR